MPTIEDIRSARERIAGGIIATPCPPTLVFGDRLPCRLYTKLENLQRTGSFKDRGALNRLLAFTEEERRRGVIAASAGNHAQAVAYHCQRLKIPAAVVMPEATPLIKVANTRRFGARITLKGATLSESLEEARRVESDEGRVLIHAFEDVGVIAGQGTIGLELLEQVPDLDVVVVPVGGGGLIAGIARAVKEARPTTRIVGVEARAAASAAASRREGRVVRIETSRTIADGIATKRIGERTFAMIEELVDDIVAVSEEQIAAAVHLHLERQKLVAEGAGAAPLAALLAGYVPVGRAHTAAIVLSGGNIDINMVSRIIDRGLLSDGRLTRLVVTVPDRPGRLARLTDCVARTGANVLEIAHHRAFADISVGDVEIALHLETRDRDHVDEIIALLEADGVRVEEHLTPVLGAHFGHSTARV